MSNITEDLVKKYKNDNVLVKTYYTDNDGIVVDGIINPLAIDNRQLMAPTDDQGNVPGCAGWSACTLVESMYWKETGKLIQLDAAHVYAKAKEIDGNVEDGTYLESSLKAAVDICGIDFINNKKIGLFYNNRNNDTVEKTKFLLHKYDFLQVGFLIDEAWYDCNQKNYVLGSYGATLGGHAVNLTGYDSQGVYVLNQWTKQWGSKGYAIMPWNIFLKELMYGAYLY